MDAGLRWGTKKGVGVGNMMRKRGGSVKIWTGEPESWDLGVVRPDKSYQRTFVKFYNVQRPHCVNNRFVKIIEYSEMAPSWGAAPHRSSLPLLVQHGTRGIFRREKSWGLGLSAGRYFKDCVCLYCRGRHPGTQPQGIIRCNQQGGS